MRATAGSGGRVDRLAVAGPALLAVALTLTSATQLRAAGTPVGPGELLLAAFVGISGLLLARVGQIRVSPLTAPWLLFWAVSLAALATGWIVGMTSGESTVAGGRDATAYLLCAAVIAVCVVQPYGPRFVVRTAAWLIVLSGVAIGSLLLTSLVRPGPIGPIQPWFSEIRFRGWAVNPNQLALLVAPLPWLAFAITTLGPRWRLVLRATALGLVAFGMLTRSDALVAAWAVGITVHALWTLTRWASRPTRSLGQAALARVIVPLTLVGLFAVGGRPAAGWLEARVEQVFREGGQGEDRVGRWGFGLEALAESPVVGFGPGVFSGATGSFGGQEAHNSPIDWATNTGLIGLTGFGLLALWVMAGCIRAGAVAATVAGLVLLLFSGLHYALRQPVAWFTLTAVAAVALVGAGPVGSPALIDRSPRTG